MNIGTWGGVWAVMVFAALATTGCATKENGETPAAPPTMAAARQVSLTVTPLESPAAEEAVTKTLSAQSGVSEVTVDRAAKKVTLTLAESQSVDEVVNALKAAGYTAQEAGHEHPEHPTEKKADHPDHPTEKKAEHPEHPTEKQPEHPDHPK